MQRTKEKKKHDDYLPGGEARCAQQMSAGLDANVFVVLGADLTQLERRSHLTVQLVLLLGHPDVIFGRVVYEETQVGCHTA